MPKPTKTACVQWLSDAGFAPRLDADGTLSFDADGSVYCVTVADEQPRHFALALLRFAVAETQEEAVRLLLLANQFNARYHSVKLLVELDETRSYVSAVVELVLGKKPRRDLRWALRYGRHAAQSAAVGFHRALATELAEDPD